MLMEVTDDEFEEAKDLPFRELCGVCSYPAACCKLELRYAISVCGRHRTKWGVKQFEVLKKVREVSGDRLHSLSALRLALLSWLPSL